MAYDTQIARDRVREERFMGLLEVRRSVDGSVALHTGVYEAEDYKTRSRGLRTVYLIGSKDDFQELVDNAPIRWDHSRDYAYNQTHKFKELKSVPLEGKIAWCIWPDELFGLAADDPRLPPGFENSEILLDNLQGRELNELYSNGSTWPLFKESAILSSKRSDGELVHLDPTYFSMNGRSETNAGAVLGYTLLSGSALALDIVTFPIQAIVTIVALGMSYPH